MFRNVKRQFSIFANQPELVYLDSAASSLTPDEVVKKLDQYYTEYRANIHRGIYANAEKATAEYEHSRREVAFFLNAGSIDEVVFTRGTTEAINIIASGVAASLKPGDEIVLPYAEHHSNFVPWQMAAQRSGATLKFLDIDAQGHILFGEYEGAQGISPHVSHAFSQAITPRTRVLALAGVSNVLGTIHPIREIVAEARKISPDIMIVLDAAQMIPHMKVDVAELDVDFVAFSGHKMFGPTGVGVLWGRNKLLNALPPLLFGGEMIDEVKVSGTTFKQAPHRFEAGTPPIAEAIALKTAVWYLNDLHYSKIRKHEEALLRYALRELRNAFGDSIRILGPEKVQERAGVLAFQFKQYHPHDVAQILDERNIAVRAGHHCAQPLHEALGLAASVRVSFSIYNTTADVDALIQGLQKVESVLQ